MDQLGLYIICGIILIFGLALFTRAYILGNRSMQKMHKDNPENEILNQ